MLVMSMSMKRGVKGFPRARAVYRLVQPVVRMASRKLRVMMVGSVVIWSIRCIKIFDFGFIHCAGGRVVGTRVTPTTDASPMPLPTSRFMEN
jgi:hypothetical protein